VGAFGPPAGEELPGQVVDPQQPADHGPKGDDGGGGGPAARAVGDGLDIGLPADQIRPALRQAMSAEDGSRTTMVDATNRRGRPVRCRVTCSPLAGSDKSVRGVIVVVEPQPEGQPAAESG
jgi:hypothetical protein